MWHVITYHGRPFDPYPAYLYCRRHLERYPGLGDQEMGRISDAIESLPDPDNDPESVLSACMSEACL